MTRRIFNRDDSKGYVVVVLCMDCDITIQQSVANKKEIAEICCPECGEKDLKELDFGLAPPTRGERFLTEQRNALYGL